MKIKAYGILLVLILLVTTLTTDYFYKKSIIYKSNIENNIIYRNIYDFNTKIYDSYYKNRNTQTHHNKSFLLAIDEESVREIGRWPWSREIIAKITDNAMKYGIKSIGYDIIFSEHEGEAADSSLTNVIKKYPDQIILGTFGKDTIPLTRPAYMDYCHNEAFLYTGGQSLVKLNATIVVDDENIQFEELNFRPLLNSIFTHISQVTEQTILKKLNKSSPKQLNIYQTNLLNTEKTAQVYLFCQRWLTENDEYLNSEEASFRKYYDDQLENISTFKSLSSNQKIHKFKSDVQRLLIPQQGSWVSNIESLQNIATYTASFVTDIDIDGVIRNYPLLFRTGNKIGTSYLPSLALQTYLANTGYQAYFTLKKVGSERHVDSVYIKDISGDSEKIIAKLPVDSLGRLIINYYNKANSLDYVSARDLFHDEEDSVTVYNAITGNKVLKKVDYLKNKSMIFGATATAIYDLRNTPIHTALPGPETHLTVLANLLDNRFIMAHPRQMLYVTISLLAISIIFLVSFFYGNLFISTIALIAINYLIYLGSFYLFKNNEIIQSLSLVIMYSYICYILLLIYVYFFETRKSQELKNTFSKYVSKEIVDEILKNQDNLNLRGQKMNMTVFFSDIRGFTSISEKMDPQELSLMLNKYFTPMAETIFSSNGTVDKFIGDAIMALFGAPINYPNHPEQACKAALKCIVGLEKLNAEFKLKNWPEVKIGIGLNTGEMVAGTIGSDQIQSYTVIGDEVNLASRIEGLTKEYKVNILISDSTYKAVQDQFTAREIDTVVVKGRQQPVTIYELLQDDQYSKSYIDQYHTALNMYKNKKYLEAKTAFSNLLSISPADAVAQIYIDKIDTLLKS